MCVCLCVCMCIYIYIPLLYPIIYIPSKPNKSKRCLKKKTTPLLPEVHGAQVGGQYGGFHHLADGSRTFHRVKRPGGYKYILYIYYNII